MCADFEHDSPTMSESDGIRYLHFGTEWIQGAMRTRKPAELVLAYTQQMMAWLMFTRPGKQDKLAILGLGAGSLLRFCLKHTPCQVRTVEWNPAVTGICQAFFRLPGSDRSQIDHEDAGVWVRDPDQHGQYRALMVDLYDASAQGPVRDSLEFYQNCRAVLDEEGIMTVNLFGAHPSFERNISHIRQAFEGKVLLLPEMDEGNQVVLAFKGDALEITAGALLERAMQVQADHQLPAQRWARELLSALRDTGARLP
ncbi:spermine/spermidine synthase domain-containing protein [Alcaligenes sp. Marseille-Q7550]